MSGNHHHHEHQHDQLGIFDISWMNVRFNLLDRIDLDNIECYNESVEGSGKTVFKRWEDRFDTTAVVRSESADDQELLFSIPFTSRVKLFSIVLVGEDNGASPREIRLYKDRPDISLETLGTATQTMSLVNTGAITEYPVMAPRFNQLTHLGIYFPGNFSTDLATKISFVGIMGDYEGPGRQMLPVYNVETRPQLKDHEQIVWEVRMAFLHRGYGDDFNIRTSWIADQFSLYDRMDLDKVECLNENEVGKGRSVVRHWSSRLNETIFVESSSAKVPRLLFKIPFIQPVRLYSVIIFGEDDGTSPREMLLYRDRPDMTFSLIGNPTECIRLRNTGILTEYAVSQTTFNALNHLSIYFPGNFTKDKPTKIKFIGVMGEHAGPPREHEVDSAAIRDPTSRRTTAN